MFQDSHLNDSEHVSEYFRPLRLSLAAEGRQVQVPDVTVIQMYHVTLFYSLWRMSHTLSLSHPSMANNGAIFFWRRFLDGEKVL